MNGFPIARKRHNRYWNASSTKEQEADAFAKNMLIDQSEWQKFVAQRTPYSKAGILEFAAKVHIAPGIVVGRLRHEKRLPFTHCNDLKRRLDWNTKEQDPD